MSGRVDGCCNIWPEMFGFGAWRSSSKPTVQGETLDGIQDLQSKCAELEAENAECDLDSSEVPTGIGKYSDSLTHGSEWHGLGHTGKFTLG